MNNYSQKFDIDPDSFVTVTDEEGNDHQCVILDIIEYKDKNYVSLVPSEVLEDDDSNENEEIDTANLFIMEVETDEDGEYLKNIEDKENYEEICKIMIDRLSEDFDIEY